MRKLLVLDGHNFAQFAEQYNNYPYGVDLLAGHGYQIAHSDWAWRETLPARVVRSVARRFDNILDKPVTSVARQILEARDSDLCLSIFEHQALTYERLRQLARGQLPRQVVMTCWMAAWSLTLSGRRFEALRFLASRAAALTVFSANQVEQLAQILDTPTAKIHVVPYGVDTNFYTANYSNEGYVAAAGNDAGRDWPTFFRACAALPNTSFRVASRHSFSRLRLPANVTVLGGLSHDEYRGLLQHAKCVVVPTHPLSYPSGQSVLLEAYAMGKPVVAVRSAAMRDYLVAGASAAYLPGDDADLACAIERLTAVPDDELVDVGRVARQAVVDRFSNAQMWRAMAAVLDGVRA